MAAYIDSDEDEPTKVYPLRIIYTSGDENDDKQTDETKCKFEADIKRGSNQRGNFRGRGRPPRKSSQQFTGPNSDESARPTHRGSSNSGRGRDNRNRGRGRGRGRGYGPLEKRDINEKPYISDDLVYIRDSGKPESSHTPRNKTGDEEESDKHSSSVFKGKNERRGRIGHRQTSIERRNKQEPCLKTQTGTDGKTTETFKPPNITLNKLHFLSKSKDDPDKLLLEIVNTRSGFSELLENPIDPKWLYYILRVLSIAITSSHRKNVREILLMVEKNLLSKISDFLNEVGMRSESTAWLYNNLQELTKSCLMIIELLKITMESLHTSLGKCKSVIFAMNELQTTFSLDAQNEIFHTEMQNVQQVLEAVRQMREKIHQEKQGKKKTQAIAEEDRIPPEAFRELSILPRMVDLQLDEKPFLRANKAEGKYKDLDTYLDIQFRLLREDYIQPLRNGIAQYKYCLQKRESVRKLRDIRLYHSVQILRPVCSSSGINYILQFDTSDFKRMNWAASRRLLYGSLVCLSNDDFETNYYAIVTERNIPDLGEGLIQVQFETLPDASANDKFIMAETTAFFEAYRYILEGLQEMSTSMPFQSYIVNCETNLKPPKYLIGSGGPEYDFACLLLSQSAPKVNEQSMYPVLNTLRWPSQNKLGFDASQFDAMKLAITKEIAIIQGPPGTGKTFIGLKITKLLMTNKQVWNVNKEKRPILVVCYTNHALDQFLEGILTFCKTGVVRIGGRCKNDMLEPYVLRNLKMKRRENKGRTWGVRQSERDCLGQIGLYKQHISEISSELKRTSTELISFDKLETQMTDEQQSSFKEKLSKEKNKYWIPIWLQMDIPSALEEDATKELTPEERMKDIWKLYILEEITEMATIDKDMISDVWAIDLYQRAQLYKAWVFEYIFEFESLMATNILQTNQLTSDNLTRVINTVDKAIYEAKTDMVSATKLLNKITNVVCRNQILMLRTLGFSVPLDNALEVWLGINGTTESMTAIKATIDQEHTKSTEPKESPDLEEERELDADDDDVDDFLFDYGEKKTKTKPNSSVDEGQWFIKWNQNKMRQKVKYIFNKARDITDEEVSLMANVWKLPQDKRRDLYRYWILKYRREIRERVHDYEIQYNDAADRLREVRDHETIEILREADFVGMTTTGAAKNRTLLQNVRPRIIIVEEAAEVLESHIITTLNEECQHLILIGDHKQLRPSTTVYELAKKYNLDVSLFERMIRNGVPCVTLSEQHRMRPEIAALMRYPNLYPNLRDHPSVREYENIQGIDANFQFIDHDKEESTSSESTSYSNPHEANYISAFCKYILNQGYSSDLITVLTPYMGQVFLLRKTMPKSEFEGVRITAVDNYQGEENDIIILSLVRSSSEKSAFQKRNPIGFLGIENRICVALSRAKKGFYVIGNFTLLREHSVMWRYMTDKMNDSGCLKKAVTLRCQNHPENSIQAENVTDFEQAPEGGCKESCDYRLKCGHLCPRFCHIIDKEHKHVRCFKPCPKKCKNGHSCGRKCWQECGKCPTFIEKCIPMCGHMAKIPCHKDSHTWECKTKCEMVLPCGHKCNRVCFSCTKNRTHEDKCQFSVSKKLLCGHDVDVKCYEDASIVSCAFPCNVVLDCKHACKGTCGECLGGKIHKVCSGNCVKVLPCGHKCSYPCSDLCPPCGRKCEWVCSHNVRCTKSCSEECDKCTETCRYKCKHKRCEKLCCEPCDEINCDERCRKNTKCDHPCSGLCGETCPVMCNACAKDKRKKGSNEDLESDDAVVIKLPDCDCTIDVHRMDTWMKEETGVRGDLFKRCPNCLKAIRKDMKRYTNTLKQSRIDISNKFKTLTGTDAERNRRKVQLKVEIDQLRQLGLDENGIKKLEKRLHNSEKAFGILHVLGKTTELLTHLLAARKRIAALNVSTLSSVRTGTTFILADTKGIVDPIKIQAVLIKDRRCGTNQLWNEIRLEIYRLDLLAKFRSMEDQQSLSDAAYSEALLILTDNKPFTKQRKVDVDEIYARLQKNTLGTYV